MESSWRAVFYRRPHDELNRQRTGSKVIAYQISLWRNSIRTSVRSRLNKDAQTTDTTGAAKFITLNKIYYSQSLLIRGSIVFKMAKLSLVSFLAIGLALQKPVSAGWDWDIFTQSGDCDGDPTLVLQGVGTQGCQNVGFAALSFFFSSNAGEELEIFFLQNCDPDDSRQVFPGNAECFSLLEGGSPAQSFDIIEASGARTTFNITENYEIVPNVSKDQAA